MPDEKTPGLRGSLLKEAQDLGVDNTNFVKEALKWQYNWIGLAGAAAFALVSGTGFPLVLAAGLELIYVAVVPQSSRFRRLVRSWQYAEEKRRIDVNLHAMYQQIPPEMQVRYGRLDQLCRGIRENYGQLSSTSQMFVKQMQDRLDGLLQGYLRLLHSLHQHLEYLRVTDPNRIQQELNGLQRSLASDPVKVQEINRKRIEILTKRLEKFGKIHENCDVINAQCAATEDVLQLIRDQSVTLRDPQQVSDQLEGLVHDVETTEETVREVESIFEMATPDMNTGFSALPSESSSSNRPSNRIRN
jgi:archaellum component FlaC